MRTLRRAAAVSGGPLAIVALTVAAATLMQPPDCNQNAHYALTRALHDGVPWIDAYANETCDVAEHEGHVYAAKAPLTAIVALPWHALLDGIGAAPVNEALERPWPEAMEAAPRSGVWQFGLVAAVLPFLGLLLLLRRAGDRVAPGTGVTVAIAAGAGTLLLPFATAPFAHVLAAFLGFAAFVTLWTGMWPLAAGILAGLAIGADFPLGILAAGLALYALVVLGRRAAAVYAVGAVVGLLPLLAFNAWAFGDPFHLAYASSQSNQAGLFGLGLPDVDAAAELLFSPKGLYTLSPLLAAGTVGLVLLWRQGARAEAVFAGGTALAFWIYDSGYWLPFGGNTPGPRFLVPVIPLLALGLSPMLRRLPLTTVALAAVSIGAMVVATLADPIDGGFDTAVWLRMWRRGDLVETVVTALGGPAGLVAVLPFLGLLAVALVLGRPRRVTVERDDLVVAAAALAAWAVLLLAGSGVFAAVAIPVLAAAAVAAVARDRSWRRPASAWRRWPVEQRALALAGLAIAAVFAVLRAIQLAGFPPFVDEALYAIWTERVAENHAWGIALANGKEPLLTWLGAGLVGLGASPLVAVKLVSLAAGAVTVVATGLIGRELAGTAAGVLAAGLAAIVPFFVVHDVIGIMEPLLAAATTVALYLQIRLARDPTPGAALLLAAAFAAALLTKRSGELALALVPLGLLAVPRRASGSFRLRWFGLLAAAVAIGWLLGSESLRLSADYREYLTARDQLGSFHSAGEGLREWRHWLDLNLGSYLAALYGYVGLPVLALALAGVGLGLRRDAGLTLLLAGWAGAPMAAAVLMAENPYPRYVHGAIPPLLALASLGALGVWEASLRLRGRRALAAAAALAGALAVPPLVRDGVILSDPARAEYPARDDKQYATDWPAGNAWVALGEELRRRGAARARLPCYGRCSFAVEWELDDSGFQLVDPESEEAATSTLLILSDAEQPEGAGELAVVWRYDRPRDGEPLLLLERR